jgi:hypothetical protein
MNDLSICTTIAWCGLCEDLNDSRYVDAFLMESCPAVFQALYLLSVKVTLSAHQTEMACVHRLHIFHIIIFFLSQGKF